MSLSQTEQAAGHGRCVYRGLAEAREHGRQVEAPVEPVAEFGEVTRQMLGTGLVVGAVQGVLDVADDRVEPAEVLEFDAGCPAAGNHGLVLNAGLGDAAEATQPVADGDAIGIEELLAPGSQFGLTKALDDVHAQRHRVTIVALGQGSDERGLVRRAAPGRLPVAFPAPVHVFDLDHATEAVLRVALEHDLQQLVLHAPSRLVGHPELTLELQRGDAVFLLGEQIHGQEPDGQRQLAVGKDRSRGERGLVAAVSALQQSARRNRAVPLGVAALRADEPVRPALGEQHRGTLLLAAVRGDKLRKTQTLLKLDGVLGHQPTPRCSTRFQDAPAGGSNREPAEFHG